MLAVGFFLTSHPKRGQGLPGAELSRGASAVLDGPNAQVSHAWLRLARVIVGEGEG